MSQRAASPLKSDRSAKRSKTTPPPFEHNMIPENIAEIIPDGDALLVLDGMSTAPAQSIGLRVSTHALSLASPIFKTKFAHLFSSLSGREEEGPQLILTLLDEDGDAMYLLCKILHLRNDKLPARIIPSLLRRLGTLAQKYECVMTAGRATVQWFDSLYFSDDPANLWEIIEAAYLWNEAIFFARFTSMWMLRQSVFTKTIAIATSTETQKLAMVMAERLSQTQMTMRNDIDGLIDPCVFTFSDGASHYIDYPPGLSPSPSETPSGKPPTHCAVDAEGAKEYLGALRDARIWPSTCWSRPKGAHVVGCTIGELVEKIKAFKDPEYDDADRCEGCLDVKLQFTEQLERLKTEQKKRLWGLCLDCYKAGGMNSAACRYEHPK